MTGLDNHCEPGKCCVCAKSSLCFSLNEDEFVLAAKWEIEDRLKRCGDAYQTYEIALMRKTLDDIEMEEREREKEMMVEKEKEAAREEGYKAGLEEAWGIARKLMLPASNGGINYSELNAIFGEDRGSTSTILEKFSIHAVKEKIAAYEAEQAEQAKPKLGDVVKCIRCGDDFQETGIIIIDGANTYTLLCQHDVKNYTVVLHKRDFVFEKTGKHFDIQSILDEIG